MSILTHEKANERILIRKLPNLISHVPVHQVQKQPKSYVRATYEAGQ
jgi:hypothetical protein